jgi:micrococcal nuclease
MAQGPLQGAGFVRSGLEGEDMSFGPRLPSAGAIVLLIAGVVLLLLTREEGEGGRERKGEPAGKSMEAEVVRVVDGDTAEMALQNGSTEGVRFIGVDTPESVAPGQPVECFGKKASRFTTGLLEGERVTLRFGEERRDVYDRLLAYVYLEDRFVNAELVRLGYARTLEIAPNVDYADRFARLQQSAANAGLGLWGAC